MAGCAFEDALTGATIAFDRETGGVGVEEADTGPVPCRSLFFPGCSMITYALPLVEAVHATLREAGEVDGASLLCCGKILEYEPHGKELRASFEGDLVGLVAATGTERIVAACPNCVRALREALERDERTAGVVVEPLPAVLAGLGYRIDRDAAARLVKGDPTAPLALCPHDSCPDRATGEFAEGLRALLPEGAWREGEHHHRASLCCGSKLRAAGRFEAADELACRNGEEALAVEADAIVTACLSCAFQLNMAQPCVQAVHYLELLYQWRVDWTDMASWVKFRFLTPGALAKMEREESARTFLGLGAPTLSDEVLAAEGRTAPLRDVMAASDVALSNADVRAIAE